MYLLMTNVEANVQNTDGHNNPAVSKRPIQDNHIGPVEKRVFVPGVALLLIVRAPL